MLNYLVSGWIAYETDNDSIAIVPGGILYWKSKSNKDICNWNLFQVNKLMWFEKIARFIWQELGEVNLLLP